MPNLKYPTAAEVVETGKAISVIDSGFMPFIPLTQQYKMGLGTESTGFTVPVKSIKSEVGRAGKWQWAYMSQNSGGSSFEPNIDKYQAAQKVQQKGQEEPQAGYGEYQGDQWKPYDSKVFLEDRNAPGAATNNLANDLRFTPDQQMAQRSAAMAAELSSIIQSYQVGTTASKKEKAEMEEESLLDLLDKDTDPQLRAIMDAARQQAQSHGALPVNSPLKQGSGDRTTLGLSPETYDWSVKDIDDLTKMYALINLMNQHGASIDNTVIGLEVTKAEDKFMGKGFKGSGIDKYKKAGNQEGKQKQFEKDVNKFMAEKRDAIMNRITKYYDDLGHGFGYLKGAGKPSTLNGFTMQVISRAREAILTPPAPGSASAEANTWVFEFPMGTKAQGGPYIVTVQMNASWAKDKDGTRYITAINYNLGYVPMGSISSTLRQTNMANLILKHLQENLQIGDLRTQQLLLDSALFVGKEIQILADRGNQLGTRFLHDMGMIVGGSFRPYMTIAGTMTNRQVADRLKEMIMENMDNPEMHKGLAKVIETAMSDSTKLTNEWKRKVEGDSWTVNKGYVYANKGGPWGGGGAGAGVAVTPLLGASSQMDLITSLQSQNRRGGGLKYTARRLTGPDFGTQTDREKEKQQTLWNPQGIREKEWMRAAWEKIGPVEGWGVRPWETGMQTMSASELPTHRAMMSWLRPMTGTRFTPTGIPGISQTKSPLHVRARNWVQHQSGMVVRK